jgi:hypothetical protein
MTKDDWMDADEAVRHIMRVTGKTRRQAKMELLKYMSDGSLPASGINPDTGEREIISSDAWPKVH